jgi:hypothetical protein
MSSVRASGRVRKANPKYSPDEYVLSKRKRGKLERAAAAAAALETKRLRALQRQKKASAKAAAKASATVRVQDEAPEDTTRIATDARSEMDTGPGIKEAAEEALEGIDGSFDEPEINSETLSSELINKAKQGPLTQEEQKQLVLSLYSDVSFAGAYAGVMSFQKALKIQFGINIPQYVIAAALKTIPQYIKLLPRIKKINYAHYDVSSLWQLCQADLAFMQKKYKEKEQWKVLQEYNDGYIGFLLVVSKDNLATQPLVFELLFEFQIDVFSKRLFARPIREKTAKECMACLKDIIKEGGNMKITTLQTDQ